MSLAVGMVMCMCLLARSLPAAAQSDDRLVLAFYYAWFDMLTWEKTLPDKPLQLYHSADVYAIQRHVREAQQAGIDALVQAWYGPEMTDNQTEANFRVLLDQAQNEEIRAAVSVDMGGPFLQSQDEVVTALRVLYEDHTQHPAYLRVDGHPVVFFWEQDKFSVATWQDIRAQVDPAHQMLWIAEGTQLEYLEAFDGLYLYSVAWSATPASVLTQWGEAVHQWSAQHNTFRYWVATVMPGYNDLVTGRPDTFVRERNAGAYYRECWDGAISSTADWVAITSFNEWMEGTSIEPSVNYGDSYLNLTAELVAEYRAAAFDVTPTPTLEPATATPDLSTLEAPVITPTLTSVADAATPTSTPYFTPTATLTPTATPFRLPTPTPYPATPTVLPRVMPTVPAGAASPTPPPPPARPLMPVEGVPPKSCAWGLALLPVLGFVAVRSRRR